MATYAPRSLNAPIGWSDSALRKTRSAGGPNATSGVRAATPSRTRAAARIASIPTSGRSVSSVRRATGWSDAGTGGSYDGSIGRAPVSSSHTPEPLFTTEIEMAIEMDPVCGMQVDTETSDLKLEHDGKTYWFCGRGCLLEFRDDPDKYLDPAYQPSM
jgi:YHS domain-containing protein